MDTNALFLTAAKKQFRFDSRKGPLTTEDLFTLHLLHPSGCDLENVAQELARQLDGATQKSFVNVTPDPRKALLEQKLEVVKTVIKVKQDEIAAAQVRSAKNAKRKVLLDAIEQAEKNKLAQASLDELQAQLAELGAD